MESLTQSQRYHFGPRWIDKETVEFRVWAPKCSELAVQFVENSAQPQPLSMTREPDGFFTLQTSAQPDGRYWIRFADGKLRPDPASRFQPEGVHGPSQLIDEHAFNWTDHDWIGIKKENLILYELHLGTFTEPGNYTSAIARLDELVALGVNAIELMPIIQSAGNRNWGYDGVNFFAPRNTYGTPDELRQLINAAHQRGLAVILDVVYNHYGPEGNYLHEFGGYVSQKHRTAWGDAPDFDGNHSKPLRDFMIANALFWIHDFHFDGLRLDAIHCTHDHSEVHIVQELGRAFAELRRQTRHELHLIAESNVYDPDLLEPLENDGAAFDALWSDDFLHSVFAILRPEDQMSNRQYHPHTDLDIVLQRGFVFQGGIKKPRRRIPITESTPPVDRHSLIIAIQNHDFIGNHPQGRRLHQLTSPSAHRAAAALMLLYPAIPMLFMGEEFAADHPFIFFVDFEDSSLREAVEVGRRREYPQHDWTDSDSPLSDSAFTRSYIGDSCAGDQDTLAWYRDLIELRKAWQATELLAPAHLEATWNQQGQFGLLRYRNRAEQSFVLVRLHPSGKFPQRVPCTLDGQLLFSQHCECAEGQSTKFLLGEHAVAIGHGTVTLN
jgi:malto-oligosyltrehalose trehalohydrolase